MTTAPGSPAISSAEAEVLRGVGAHLIPAAHGMSSAADVIDDAQLTFVLRSRPDLIEPLRTALRPELGDNHARRLATLASDDPVAHLALQLVVVGAYYTDAVVRRRLGYPGQTAKPVNALAFPEYLTLGLLDAVVARGPIWRDPGGTHSGGTG